MPKPSSTLPNADQAALMSELGRAGGASPEVKAYALGGEGLRTATRLAGMDRIGERFARRLRGVIEPFARAKPVVTPEPIDTRRFETWRDALPEFTSLSLYRLRPLKGAMMIAIEPDFVTRLVDAFYGGSGMGPAATHRAREFTAAEERLLGRLTESLAKTLEETWAEVVPLELSLVGRETNASYASLVRGDEPVVIQRFLIATPQGPATSLDLVYPLAALRPLEAQLSAKVHDDAGPADSDFRYRMARALQAVRLPVRSVLARPTLSVQELLDLKPGDVIPITLNPKVPLIVGNRRMAEGTIGEREGRAALMIETIDNAHPLKVTK